MTRLRPSSILDPALEQESAERRRERLGARLRALVAHAHARSPYVRRTLDAAGLAPRDVRGLDDLARLPITRKDELPAIQAEDAPFGGMLGVPLERLARIFMSPGPIFDPRARRTTSGDSGTGSPRRASAPARSSRTPRRTT